MFHLLSLVEFKYMFIICSMLDLHLTEKERLLSGKCVFNSIEPLSVLVRLGILDSEGPRRVC